MLRRGKPYRETGGPLPARPVRVVRARPPSGSRTLVRRRGQLVGNPAQMF
jgi:hypothetical protein